VAALTSTRMFRASFAFMTIAVQHTRVIGPLISA
jgi:hypothetical protein